jgi:hypothetical protein
MKYLILALVLACATVAHANGNDVSNDCPGNSCHAQGGDGGDASAVGIGIGGDARATGGSAKAEGGDANARSSSNSDADATAKSTSSATGVGVSGASSDNSVSITEKSNVKVAASAGDVRGESAAAESPCGDVSSVSAQGGLFGGGVARPTFTCHVARHLYFQQRFAGEPSAKLESVVFWFTAIPQALFSVVF